MDQDAHHLQFARPGQHVALSIVHDVQAPQPAVVLDALGAGDFDQDPATDFIGDTGCRG
jgi:hypothetical protein